MQQRRTMAYVATRSDTVDAPVTDTVADDQLAIAVELLDMLENLNRAEGGIRVVLKIADLLLQIIADDFPDCQDRAIRDYCR
ncbi:hypothetical protein WH297_25355 [Ochrobactrum vermis]|uniref:Uncharacterized protein n=1 Tax=Ochrobactrum vermis TaxID=1827297 RepID=A0ABU8PLA0_9HYPH|nr:hypothetical protein [Ochrobactrum vermis]